MSLSRCNAALALFALLSCGLEAPAAIDAGQVDAGQVDAGVSAAALTSTAFADGGVIPARHSCAGLNLSVPLSWSTVTSAQSYAGVMTDTSINLIHWVIWDIPASVLALPEGVPNVALPPSGKQTTSYDAATFGYLGPCPPSTHTYRFELFGLDTATLPGVTTASSRAQVKASIASHQLGRTQELSGSYSP